MFFELIVNYERVREKKVLLKINFLNFMALIEVIKLIAHIRSLMSREYTT
jgi:hypothetical protein